MKKQKWMVLGMAILFFGMSVFCWAKPSDEYSVKERRKLKQMPEVSIDSILTGKFMSSFEEYALDQFPFRDGFLTLQQKTSTTWDRNGVYLADGHLVDMEYPMNEEALERAANIFRKMQSEFFPDNKVCLSIIPDKNLYLAKGNRHLCMDYDALYEKMQEATGFDYIDITEYLSLEDYYYTDGHWRQESIVDVAGVIAEGMGTEISREYAYDTLMAPFYGAYYGQYSSNLPADTIMYLTNDAIKGYKVYDHQNQKEMGAYDMDKAYGKDAYEIFLSGPLSLVTIENPTCQNGKHLVMFRDSFGSSIAPILAEGYEKVTLVDIRYIASSQVCRMIDFEKADVLFLYSTLVLNNAETLK